MKVQSGNRSSRLRALFRRTFADLALNTEVPVMRKLRGYAEARTLLIAPPCNEVDYWQKMPFSSPLGQLFHDWLLENGWKTDKDFVIVSCSAFGTKLCRASTLLIREFVSQCAQSDLFDRYTTVGIDAYQYVFGDGRIKSPFMPGAIIYPKLLHVGKTSKPLFTWPNIEPLLLSADEGTREYFQQLRSRNYLINQLEGLRKPFNQFMRL